MRGSTSGADAARRSFNPMLFDGPVLHPDPSEGSCFYTPKARRLDRRIPLIATGVCGGFVVASFAVARGGGPAALSDLFVFLGFIIGAIPGLQEAWKTIRARKLDIDVLMLGGAGLAAIIGEPLEGALLLFLFSLASALEGFALQRTERAIDSLRALAPSEAVLLTDDGPTSVRLGDIRAGARILIRPGQRVPLDGRVVEGSSALDESAITGESMPRDKAVGDDVFAGTLNVSGRLVVEVTRLAGETALARTIALVTQARENRAPAQTLIDRLGPRYSVAVVLGSVGLGLGLTLLTELGVRESVYRAIMVLIVASPCALIISTPVAYLSAVAGAARKGVLIKGGAFLETLAKAAVIVFDKTGTLTTGRVQLTDVVVLDGLERDEVIRIAGAVAGSSTHPLATAVTDAVRRAGLTAYTATDFASRPGQGLCGTVNGVAVNLGRPETLADELEDEHERGRFLAEAEHVRRAGKTAAGLLAGQRGAILAFEDTPRPAAREMVSALRRQGVGRLEMLTGDHALVARVTAEQLGLDAVHAEMLPEEKLATGQALRRKYGMLVMVGDGINDAPALADADVGIAVASIGADVALDAADMVLMNNRIESVAWVHQLARRTVAVVRQNLTLAIGVIVILTGFAAAGRMNLPVAVLLHEGSTLIVALNGLRLLRG